jgi:hypothetical protein
MDSNFIPTAFPALLQLSLVFYTVAAISEYQLFVKFSRGGDGNTINAALPSKAILFRSLYPHSIYKRINVENLPTREQQGSSSH